MSETKDPAIKLFGKTIQLPLCEKNPVLLSNNEGETGILTINQDSDLSSAYLKDKKLNSNHGEEQTYDKDSYETKENNGGLESPPILEELTITTTISSGVTDNPKSSSIEKEAVDKRSSRKEEGSETDLSQEKTLKKPDKILPCPRCNSMDTKFCYYNNYNVNQPRHFCKNCQRYWTAGGTMRNVPVGAGRRKNKNSTSLYRQLSVSEALQTTKAHIVDGIQHPSFKQNGTVLTFGSDSPLCDSMASVLSLTDQAMRNCTRNGLHRTEEHKVIDSNGGLLLNEDENSSRCSTNEGSRVGIQDSAIPCHGFTPQMQCFPGPPWAYHPWNSTVSPPGFCASTFPIPIYPSNPYWACPVPGSWTVPWLPPLSSSPNSCPPTPSPFSPTLGKHSREGDILRPNPPAKDHKISEENSEHCLWIPKTLRIDDPGEAARSSIWETLGIKNNPDESLSGGRLFKAFQSKVDEKKHKIEASPAFQANPAALSRSLNFQESSQLSC